MNNDPSQRAHDGLVEAVAAVREMRSWIETLRVENRDLLAKNKDDAARADEYEARADKFEKQADYGRRLEHVAVSLVAALDSLPTTMEHADMIPSSHPPDVALYGTYSWQNVVDAARLVKQVLGTCGE